MNPDEEGGGKKNNFIMQTNKKLCKLAKKAENVKKKYLTKYTS
jgi:hypothetical protein